MAVGASVGAAAGAAATTAIMKPNVLGTIIGLPFRVLNAPFYYALGGKSSDDRLKFIELAATNASEAQVQWFKTLQEMGLRFDGIEIKLSKQYILALKGRFAGAASAVAGSDSSSAAAVAVEPTVRMVNPNPPSFCSVGSFLDPFNERYTCIVLNDQARYMVCSVLVIVVTVSGVILVMYFLRLAVRYSLRGQRAFQRVVKEEWLAENKQALQRDFGQTFLEREFAKPSPMTELK